MCKRSLETSRKVTRIIIVLLSAVVFVAGVPVALAGSGLFNNPYEGVSWTHQHKGNLHTHTTQSDGSLHPSAMIDQYASRGYSILALTDHNTVTYPWTAYGRNPATLGMIAIQGSEPSRAHHHGSFFNGYNGSSSNVDTSLQTIQDNGGLSMFYHPGRYSYNAQWYVDRYNTYPSLVGMEVYNQGNRYVDLVLWDQVLTELMPDRPVWGYSNGDSHTTAHVDRNWSVFLLPELSEAAVRNAMVEGQSYFSYTPTQGAAAPTISMIAVDQSAGTISITAAGYTQIRWISEGNQIATGATFDYFTSMACVEDSYVRAELHGPTGITYTQPFGVVPEPATMSLLVLGGLALLRRRKRRT